MNLARLERPVSRCEKYKIHVRYIPAYNAFRARQVTESCGPTSQLDARMAGGSSLAGLEEGNESEEIVKNVIGDKVTYLFLLP